MHTSLATYQVFLTRNSEYHLQSHVCVGVRDRRTGLWLDAHPALHRPLTTTVRTAGQLAPLQRPQLGESLEFELDDARAPLRTSPVLNIEERGGTSQRSVIAPRAASGLELAATLPAAAPLTPAPTPLKPPATASKAKRSRWPFRRRPRVPTAERNLAQPETRDSHNNASGITVRSAAETRRLAR